MRKDPLAEEIVFTDRQLVDQFQVREFYFGPSLETIWRTRVAKLIVTLGTLFVMGVLTRAM